MLATHCGFGAFLCGSGACDIDVFCQLGIVGKDRHVSTGCLDVSTVNGEILYLATLQVDTRVVLSEKSEERRVSGKERDFSPALGSRDDLRGDAGKQHTLG